MNPLLEWEIIHLPYTYLYTLFFSIIFSQDYRYFITFYLFILFGEVANHYIKIMFSSLHKNLTARPSIDGIIVNGKCMGCGIYPNKPKNSSGFPSGHTQITTLFSSFYTLWILRNYEYSSINIFGMMVTWIFTFMACYQRVLSKCHSIIQVIFGCLFGLFFSFISYNICHRIYPEIFKMSHA